MSRKRENTTLGPMALTKRLNNEYLAQWYLKCKTISGPATSTIVEMRKRIAAADIDIAEYYKEHKTIRPVKIEGVGRMTKMLLEDILSRSFKVVYIEKVYDARNAELKVSTQSLHT